MTTLKTPDEVAARLLHSHVRFTLSEYTRLRNDQLLTGKSIPWLLKAKYFKGEIAPPALDETSRRAVVRELSYMGNNMNQLARAINSGIVASAKDEFVNIENMFRMLCSYLGKDYGQR